MNMHEGTMFFLLQIVFLVYNQVCHGQRKMHIPRGYKHFPGTYIVKQTYIFFQKIVLDSQKVSESMVSAVALLFLKGRLNLAFMLLFELS